jgi:uncharacterized protein (TIRG00374 family)
LDQRIQLLLNLLVSLAIFAALFWLVGAGRIYETLLGAKPELLALALVAYSAVTFVMAYRIRYVLAGMKEKLSLMQVVPSNLAGLLASDFTPARAGYFFSAFSLSSKFGIATEKTVTAIFGPQLFDFLIKVFSAIALTLLIVSKVGAGSVALDILVVCAALGAILFAGLFVFHPPFLELFSFAERLPVVPILFSFLRRMHVHSGRVLDLKWGVMGLTFLAWMLKGTEWLFLSRALGISVTGSLPTDLVFMMAFQAAITLIQFVPSPTLAGAGASEAAFAAVLLPFGIPFETSVAFGFLTRLSMIVVDSLSLPVIVAYLHKHSMESILERISGLGH